MRFVFNFMNTLRRFFKSNHVILNTNQTNKTSGYIFFKLKYLVFNAFNFVLKFFI